jgi:Ca-activated chloride channel family protein
VPVPSSSTTILLALDVSGSMCSSDVEPNRLTAAEKAAADFIKAQPSGAKIGLVAFAGIAAVTVPPTTDTKQLLDALPGLTTSRGTAIGQAILTSIDAIADIDPSVPATGAQVDPNAGDAYAADVIVVLTDGANTQGVEPKTAAQEAAARKLRVYTIGFGTTTPAPMVCDASQIGDSPGGPFGGGGGGPFGGGGRGGGGALVADYASLQQVAAATGGQFYAAKDAGQLQSALGDLPRAITVTHKDRDLAALFAGIGGLLVAAAVGLSLWWNRVRSVPRAVPS